MAKILLMVEDYNESRKLQTILPKLGFEVQLLNNESLLSSIILSFNPQIIYVSGEQIRFSGMGVAKKMVEFPRWQGKIILGFAADAFPDEADLAKVRVDLILPEPVSTETYIQVFAEILNENPDEMLKKWMKFSDSPVVASNPDSQKALAEKAEIIRVSGGVLKGKKPTVVKAGNSMEPSDAEVKAVSQSLTKPTSDNIFVTDKLKKANQNLSEKVAKYLALESKLSSNQAISKQTVRKIQKEMMANLDKEELHSLDELRREFTDKLFKK